MREIEDCDYKAQGQMSDERNQRVMLETVTEICKEGDVPLEEKSLNVKIRVTPEKSAKIQQICFKNRVFWVTGRSTISFVEEPFLFIGSNK